MRRRYFTFGLLFLAAALFLVWRIGYHGQDPRLIVWPPPEDNFAPPAALDEVTSIDVWNMSLRDVVALLAKQHNVEIELDSLSLALAGRTDDDSVSCRLSGIRLRSLLSLLGRDYDLDVHFRNGVVYLADSSSWQAKAANYVTRVYTLEDFASCPGGIQAGELAHAIMKTLGPSNWNQPGGLATLETLPGALLVTQTYDGHHELTELLRAMAAPYKKSRQTSSAIVSPTESPAERRIEEALMQPAQIKGVEVPLEKVIDRLSTRHEIPIRLDLKALAASGIGPDHPMTCRLRSVSLGLALKLLLADLECTYIVQDEVLLVVPQRDGKLGLVTRVYHVGDLLLAERDIDADVLIDAIQEAFPRPQKLPDDMLKVAHCAGSLIVATCYRNHQRIEQLLAGLRRVLREPPLTRSAGSENTPSTPIDTALAKRISVKLQESPLRDACDEISRRNGVAIHIDTRALDGVGVSSDTPISFEVQDVPLEAALRRLLKPLDLTLLVNEQVIIVTSHNPTNNLQVETRCYPIYRFFDREPRSGVPLDNTARWLGQAICDVVEPESWHDYGGAGGLSVVGNVLVVTQTRDVHDLIADLLRKFEQIGRTRLTEKSRVLTRRYELTDSAIDQATDRPIDLSFTDIPLYDVAERLSAACGIPIRLDLGRLGQQDIASDLPVSVKIRKLPLRTALDSFTRRFGLTWQVHDSTIWITSRETAARRLETRLYDVRDLALWPNRDGLDSLIDNVVGGNARKRQGSIHEVENVLLLRDSSAVHAQITLFLAALRRLGPRPQTIDPVCVGAENDKLPVESSESDNPPEDSDESESRTRTVWLYPVADLQEPADAATDETEQVQRLVGPAWKGRSYLFRQPPPTPNKKLLHSIWGMIRAPDPLRHPEGSVNQIGGILAVVLTPEEQAKVAAILADLRSENRPSPGVSPATNKESRP